MADYNTQFSCILDVGSAENALEAESIRDDIADEIAVADGDLLGFDMTPADNGTPGALWLSSDGDGDPEHVIKFVLACAETFDLQGLGLLLVADLLAASPRRAWRRRAADRPRRPEEHRLGRLRALARTRPRPGDRQRDQRHNGRTGDHAMTPAIARDPEIDDAIARGAQIVFNLSGGKDSTAAMFATIAYLDRLGHPATGVSPSTPTSAG